MKKILFFLCLAFSSLCISQTPTMTFQPFNPTCFNAANGTIYTTVTDGTAPFTFKWSNGKTTRNINQLAAGDYTVTVTAANGATGTGTVTLTEPPPLQIDNVTIVANNNGNYKVTVIVSGGTPDYQFSSNIGQPIWQNSNVFPDLPAGTYVLKVRDGNLCPKSVAKKIPATP